MVTYVIDLPNGEHINVTCEVQEPRFVLEQAFEIARDNHRALLSPLPPTGRWIINDPTDGTRYAYRVGVQKLGDEMYGVPE